MGKNLNILIYEVAKEKIENIPVPLKEEVWENIITGLQNYEKGKNKTNII